MSIDLSPPLDERFIAEIVEIIRQLFFTGELVPRNHGRDRNVRPNFLGDGPVRKVASESSPVNFASISIPLHRFPFGDGIALGVGN